MKLPTAQVIMTIREKLQDIQGSTAPSSGSTLHNFCCVLHPVTFGLDYCCLFLIAHKFH